jgi:rare lipoprotein A
LFSFLIWDFKTHDHVLLNSAFQNADIYTMKRISALLPVLCAAAFCIPWYVEAQAPEIFRQEGIASWYGPEFDGRPTASGEVFNSSFFTAAHPNLPFGTMLLITNRHNNKQVTVRVNDRGPFVSARIIDVSKAAAEQLDMVATGTAPVLVESIDRIVMPSAGTPATPDPYWTLPPSEPAAPVASAAPQVPVSDPVPAYTPPPTQTYAPSPAYPPAAPSPPPASPVQTYVPVQEYPPAISPSPVTPPPAPVAAPVPQAPVYGPAKLTPAITPSPDKMYRLQVGSYKVAKYAVAAFEKLKNAGLNPAYERNGEYFRVVLAGIRGSGVQSATEKIGAAGFKEALIREER